VPGADGFWLTHADLCDVDGPVLTPVAQRLANLGLMRWITDPRVDGTRNWLWQATPAGTAWLHSGSPVPPDPPAVTHSVRCEDGGAVVTLHDPTGLGVDGTRVTVCVAQMVGSDSWLHVDDHGRAYVAFRDERHQPLAALLRHCADTAVTVAEAAARDVLRLHTRFSEQRTLATDVLPLLRTRQLRLMPFLREHADAIAREIRLGTPIRRVGAS
jgi:hypothetical protein